MRFAIRYDSIYEVYIVYIHIKCLCTHVQCVSAATVISMKRERERERSLHSRWVGRVPIINVHLMVSKLECNHNKQRERGHKKKKQIKVQLKKANSRNNLPLQTLHPTCPHKALKTL